MNSIKMKTLCGVLAALSQIAFSQEAITYDYRTVDGGIALSAIASGTPSGTLEIPATYAGQKVVAVGVAGRDHEAGIFADTAITGLIVPEGVKELGCGAFHGCQKLASVKLPSTLRFIRDNCFEDCSALKSIALPEGLETVEHDFLNRTGVSVLNIPSTLVNIEEGALAIPSGRTFTVACGNPRYRVENDYVYDYVDKIVFMRANYHQKTFDVPDGAVRIAKCCFADCGCGKIVLPATISSIGARAFAYCEGLTVIFKGSEPSVDPHFYDGNPTDDTIFYDSTDAMVYVQPGQGWESIVASGTWQGCPIKYADGGDDPEAEDGGFTGEKAMMFNGLVKDADGALCGIAQIATAKATAKGVKVSGSVMLSDGRKQTLKAVTVPIENGQLNVETKAGKTDVSLTITGDGFTGTFGDLSLASADVGEDTGILSGTLKMSYFDAKTGKIKTKSLKLTGVASEGEASGELTVKGEATKTFAAEVE